MQPVRKQACLAVLGLCVEDEVGKDAKFVILIEASNKLADKVLEDLVGRDLLVLDLLVRCLRWPVLLPVCQSVATWQRVLAGP